MGLREVLPTISIIIYVLISKNLLSLFNALPEVLNVPFYRLRQYQLYIFDYYPDSSKRCISNYRKSYAGLIIDIIRIGVITIPLSYCWTSI